MLDRAAVKKPFADTMAESKPKLDGLGLVPPSSDDPMLPTAGEGYRAAAVPVTGPLVELWVILASEHDTPGGIRYWIFQYVHLDSRATVGYDDAGQVVTLHFLGGRPVTMIVRGRDLLLLTRYVSKHRMAWIRVADEELNPEDAVDDNGQPVPFIASISIIDTATGEILAGA